MDADQRAAIVARHRGAHWCTDDTSTGTKFWNAGRCDAALLAEENERLRGAAQDVLTLCECPPDWLMQDGSHHRDCWRASSEAVALRAALDGEGA